MKKKSILGVLASPAEPSSEPEAPPAAAASSFVVLEDAEIVGNRAKILLRKGKTVSSRTHDIEGLRSQGVKLGAVVA